MGIYWHTVVSVCIQKSLKQDYWVGLHIVIESLHSPPWEETLKLALTNSPVFAQYTVDLIPMD